MQDMTVVKQSLQGTWKVPQSALPDISEALTSAVKDGWTGTNAHVQWSYLVDFTEWLDVVFSTPVMEDNTFEPTEGLEAASEVAVEVLRIIFPEKHLYQGKMDLSSLLAYVVKHITNGKVCIVTNMAHMHLFDQLNHSVLIDWQSTCYQEGHITLWPAPMQHRQHRQPSYHWPSQAQSPDTQAAVGPDTQAAVGPDTQAAVGPDTQAAVGPDTQAAVGPDTQAAPYRLALGRRFNAVTPSCLIRQRLNVSMLGSVSIYTGTSK
eukprot:jgi/Astpho2/6760/fgenesh1_pg.00102_%23_33_t